MTYILQEAHTADDPARLDRAWAAAESFVFLPSKAGVSDAFLRQTIEALPAELARDHFLLLTSGSTGEPKVVVGNRQRAMNLAGTLHQVQDSEPVEETIVALPLSYSYAFVNQWCWSRGQGRRLVHTAGFAAPGALLTALRSASNAMLCMVGAQVAMMASDFGGESFPGVVRLHFAGGRFPQERLGQLRKFFPQAQIFNNFGCAEAMPRLTCRPAEDSDDAANVGRPLPGIELRTDDNGELVFRSPYGAVGFIDAVGFRSITPVDWITSGDLGAEQPNGSWVLSGRRSEVFKRYGERISLSRIATTTSEVWPGSLAFFREVDAAGEEGFVMVLAPEPVDEQLRAILKTMRTNHPRTHWPLRIESVASLPLLPSGKVDTQGLAELAAKKELWRQRI